MEYKYLFAILLALIPFCCTKAQRFEAGITLDAGIGAHNLGLHIATPYEGYSNLKSKWALSGNVGLFVQKGFGKRSMIGIELLFVVLQGNTYYNENSRYGWTGAISSVREVETKSQFTYLATPIYYSLNFGKLTYKLGWQTMFMSKKIYDARQTDTSLFINNETVTDTKGEYNNSISKIEMGPKLGIAFQVSKKTSLSFQYYHAIINAATGQLAFDTFPRQITLGLQYYLTKHQEKQ